MRRLPFLVMLGCVATITTALYLLHVPARAKTDLEGHGSLDAFLLDYRPGGTDSSIADLVAAVDCVRMINPPNSEVVADAAAADPEADDVWAAHKRLGSPRYPEAFFLETALFELETMYRSPYLNSYDKYLSPAARRELADYSVAELAQIREIESRLLRVAWRTVQDGIRDGTRKSLALLDTDEAKSAAAQARAGGFLLMDWRLYKDGLNMDRIYSCGNLHYGFRWAELPETRYERQVLKQLRLTFSVNVATWFRNHEAMSNSDLGDYIDRSMTLAEEGG